MHNLSIMIIPNQCVALYECALYVRFNLQATAVPLSNWQVKVASRCDENVTVALSPLVTVRTVMLPISKQPTA